MTSLKKKSITGFVWNLIGSIGLQGVGFFVSIILARILVPEDFGILAIIMVFINLANVFLDFGFATALVQRSEVTEQHYSSVFFMNLAMGCLMGTIVFFSAPFIADFYDKSVLIDLIRVMSVCFIINAFGNVTRAHLRREMNFKLMSYASIASAIISGAIAVYMAYNGYGVWSLVIQLIVGQLLSNVFLYLGCKLHFSLRFSFKSLKELWSFSSRLFFAGLLDTLFINIDSLLIGKLLSPATLGYYYRAKSLENFSLRYTSSSLSSVLLPGLSSIQNDSFRLNKAVLKIFNILSFISFLACGLLFISANEIIIIMFGNKWEPSVIIFKIIIIGSFASQIGTITYNTLLITGNTNKYFKINVISKMLLLISFSSLLIFDLNTYVVFYTIIQIFIYVLGVVIIDKILHLNKSLLRLMFKYLLIYGVSVSILLFVKHIYIISNLFIGLMFNSILFFLVFLLIAWFMKCDAIPIINTEFIKPLINRLKINKI